MRRLLVALLALALLTLTGCSGGPGGGLGPAKVDVAAKDVRELKDKAGVEPCRPGDGRLVDGGLPDITLPCLGGGKDVDLSSLRGPMVINLWASWCGPCRAEMPILQRFHQKYADRVPVLGINYQDVQPYAAMQLVEQAGVTYPLLADPQASLNAAKPLPVIHGLPMMVFVDAQGRVVDTKAVAIKSLGELEELVRTKLGIRL